jgi:hypothetical protein
LSGFRWYAISIAAEDAGTAAKTANHIQTGLFATIPYRRKPSKTTSAIGPIA